ncbi:tripartite motif-containing protein 2-like [Gigantopelta aegis]|uniref:tripartite motif-containing protein 2-like n=1 Tax=Gigantopelta aegis TaxID=1735272 RepID=UPI001B88874F|nr:tripartite motif-containing protein 2-like [Gigantopelta aegis]XP_041369982.1 tripartite motif-containing protein 2-like [Gigantopelta aegis]
MATSRDQKKLNDDNDTAISNYINSEQFTDTGTDARPSFHRKTSQNDNTYTNAPDVEATTTLPDDCADDDVSKLLTCFTCNKRYKEPKLLVCLHSCCARCLQTYTETGQTKIICQFCRNSQPFPDDSGLQGVSPSYTLQDIMSALSEPAPTKETCEACEKEKHPEFMCPTCNVAICDACRVAHGNLKITKNHEIIRAKSIKMSPLEVISGKQRTCEKDGESIDYRCKTCGVFVCYKEMTVDHKGHKLETLKDVRNKEKKHMMDLERKAKQTIKFSNSIKSSVKSHESKVLESLGALELTVDKAIGEAVKTLNEQATTLKCSIQIKRLQEAKKMADILQEASQIERFSTSVRNIMQNVTSNSSDIDALTLYSCCEQIFAEARTDKIGITYGNELFFKPSDSLLQIQTSTECGKICELGNYPDFLHTNETMTLNSISNISGLARSKYGEIALTSYWNNKFVLIGPEGGIIRDVSKHVMRPWDVAFTNDNAMVISEGGDRLGHGMLKLFSPAGTFVRNIRDNSKSPGGIAVDRNGRLLVCDDHEACVKIFSLGGNLLDQIKSQDSEYQFQGPLYVTTNINDDVIVCDDHRSIKIFTSSGHAKSIYKVSDKHYLQGVCTDDYGQILVIDSVEKGIHVLTANGDLRRFVVLEELTNVSEMQTICTRSPTSVMIAGKSSKVLIVELFQDQNLSERLT